MEQVGFTVCFAATEKSVHRRYLYVLERDVRFVDQCWHVLPVLELETTASEVAMGSDDSLETLTKSVHVGARYRSDKMWQVSPGGPSTRRSSHSIDSIIPCPRLWRHARGLARTPGLRWSRLWDQLVINLLLWYFVTICYNPFQRFVTLRLFEDCQSFWFGIWVSDHIWSNLSRCKDFESWCRVSLPEGPKS